MCNLFVDGIIFSFGVFLSSIETAFDVSEARVALVGSLQTGFYLMAGTSSIPLAPDPFSSRFFRFFTFGQK